MSTALLDGDIVAYRSSVAAQENIDWGDGAGLTVNFNAAVSNAHSITKKWLELARCSDALLCFSPLDGGNFRKLLGGNYKAYRGTTKPEAYYKVIESLSEEWPTKTIPMLEADDVMGIYQTSEKTGETVIVSIDKDMKTIPGKLLNPLKDKRPRLIRPFEADLEWMAQTLIGDRIDGYSGCPSIGDVRARRALEAANTLAGMWRIVRDLFLEKGQSEADAILNARYARILRRADYDKDMEEVILWHPNPRNVVRLPLSGTPN